MIIRMLSAIGLAFGMIVPEGSWAQAAPESLSIAIEEPTSDSVSCGVSKSDVLATLRSAMRYNRIREDQKSAAVVYVSFQGFRVASASCAGTYRLAILKIDKTELGGTMRWTTNAFCEESYLLSGPNLSQYREPMRRDFDACLSSMQDHVVQ